MIRIGKKRNVTKLRFQSIKIRESLEYLCVGIKVCVCVSKKLNGY
jgi:hypothetical protein